MTHHWRYKDLRPYKVGLHLSNRGYKVCLLLPGRRLTLGYRKKVVNGDFSLYFCPTILPRGLKKGSDPLDLLTKLYLMRTLRYDCIFAFDSRPTVILPAVHGKWVKRVPLIVDWTDWFGRGGIISERSGRLYRFFFEKIETFFEEHFRLQADSSTVICAPLGKRLRDMGYEKQIHDFPLGCDPVVDRGGDILSRRGELNLPTDVRLIGCVGSLLASDAALLFESFEIVRSRLNAGLLLIGDNGLKQRKRTPYGTLQTGRVTREDLQRYLQCCDLVVLPLRNNIANNGRWPSKLNDYLVMGKPVVSTEISIVTELLKIHKFGVLAKDTPEDFAEKIYDLLMDPERLDAYGCEALRLASNHLSWPEVIDRLDDFIRETPAALTA